jgi:ribosomal protein S27AE
MYEFDGIDHELITCAYDGNNHELDPACPWCGDTMILDHDRFFCFFCGYVEEAPHAAGI